MNARSRLDQVRSRRTAAKAGSPSVVTWKAEIRSDFRDAAQTRLAEALARTQPTEAAAIQRAKAYSLGLVNATFAVMADVAATPEGDETIIALAVAGLGANVVQESDDREVVANVARASFPKLLGTA